jgi:hypothetical protein
MEQFSQMEWGLIFAAYVVCGLISYGLEYSADAARYERKKPGYKYEESRKRRDRKSWYATIFMCGPCFMVGRIISAGVKILF